MGIVFRFISTGRPGRSGVSNASMYFSRVFGPRRPRAARGGGLALSQPVVSSQSRTNCLSNDGCGPPGRYAFHRPVPRAVGREHLVDQQQLAGLARRSPIRTWCRPGSARARARGPRPSGRPPGSSIVTSRRPPCRPRRPSSRTRRSRRGPISALVAGVKIGSIRSLSTSPAGSSDAADRPRRAVLLPAAAREIAPHHALERHDPGLADHHRPARRAPRAPRRSDRGRRRRSSVEIR